MTERNDLISMGFSPERVEWAIRDTPPDSDMQTRLDHIFEHENQPVPSIERPVVSSPPTFPTAYAGPSHPPPPPFVDYSPTQQHGSDHGFTTSNITDSMGQLDIRSPSPVLPSRTLTFEEESLERYQEFLVGQQANFQDTQSRKETAKTTYIAVMKFFEAEGLKWRDHLQLSAAEATSITNNTTSSSHYVPPAFAISPPTELPSSIQESGPEASASTEAESTMTQDLTLHDYIAVYDPARILSAVSDSMAEVLSTVITAYYEDEPVEDLRKNIQEIRPRMTDQISDMRWQALRTTQADLAQDAQQRSTQHHNRLSGLQSRGDWNEANRLEEEYKQQECLIRQQEDAKKHQKFCQIFLEPARESIHEAFTELHPLYAELQRLLEEDNWELDVVRAVRALEEVSDLMEQGMTDLETMEDDRRSREFELQRQMIMDDSRRSDAWGDATRLENQKKLNDVEIKASRAAQKVDRRSPFFALACRRMEEAIAGVDRDKELLGSAIQELVTGIPKTIPLDQEEARAKSGDDAPSKIPLPSKLLFNQMNEAHSSLLSINTMSNDMRDVLKSLQRKQVFEGRARDMAQLELSEHHQGRGDSWYFGAGSALRQQGEKEDEAGERLFEQERSDRRAADTNGSTPISTVLRQYKDREMLVLHKLAGGMTANGPMSSSSSGIAVGARGDANTAALAAMQRMFQQQQQAQTISNTMWSQHASRMSPPTS